MMKTDNQIYFWAHMLDEAFNKHMLSEGKHWPADYVKTGINLVKASQLGQQSWYSDSYVQQDMQTFANEFEPLSHKNSNLGFFSTIVKWFISYAGTSKDKYQEFIERKLDGIIGTLQTILNDPSYDKIKDEIKQKWTLQQFEELQNKIADEAKASSDEKLKIIIARDDYDVIPIYSYEELHEKFGGNKTGYKGVSEWCHTNGQSTYESWTKNGTQMFFVLAKKDWQKVFQPEERPTGKDYNAYDKYGLSLIAILVDVATGNLLNETLRWNHIVDPSKTNPGASVDKAFKNNWGELSQTVGMDVKSVCEKECRDLKAKLENIIKNANEEVEKILSQVDEIDKNTIPKILKKHITSVVIPNSVKSVWTRAFSDCSNLTNVTIPDSVTSIENWAFYKCSSLKSVTIPNSMTSIGTEAFSYCSILTSVTIGNGVTSIGDWAFYGCRGLTSVTFLGKTRKEVQSMKNYSFGIEDVSIIKCENNLNENKAAYLQKYRNEADVKSIVDMFWAIRNRLSAPQNDIDWWIKKPFADLKKFVQSQQYAPNKRQRRDADYRMEAMQNDAKVLGERDGYEIWYVPTYEAMKILGRFYKGRSAKWCVASDDPEYWFENHDNDEFVLLIREQPLNDEFDKIAVQMENKGYHFSEDSIIPWDIENNDCTFDRGVVDNAPELIRYAWKLFKENGELREHYYDTEY